MQKRLTRDMTEQPHHIRNLEDLSVYLTWNLDNYDMIMEEFPRAQYSKTSTHLREALTAVRGFLKLDDARLEARSAELVAERARGIDIFLPIPAEKWPKDRPPRHVVTAP